MDKTRTVKKLTEWETCSSRPVGRPRLRWLDQVEEDLKKMKVRNWREKCKDRRLWKAGQNPPRVVAPTEEGRRRSLFLNNRRNSLIDGMFISYDR